MDQPSLLDTMASTARIAQGLKDEEPVENKTFSETLNTESATFKHFTVKQVFPREPYRLKMHKNALTYQTKPPITVGFGDCKPPANFQMSQRMAMDMEELARRFAIYASQADSMVASVISELSPRDERTKLLKEKVAVIQEVQVAAMSSGFVAASKLQLLRRDALLQNFGLQSQVLTCLPFGLATSSREFTKLLRPIVAWLRQQGVKLHVYLDNWLIRTESPEQAQMHSEKTISILQRLGWVINFEKSDLTPSQDFQFLGMHFNT